MIDPQVGETTSTVHLRTPDKKHKSLIIEVDYGHGGETVVEKADKARFELYFAYLEWYLRKMVILRGPTEIISIVFL